MALNTTPKPYGLSDVKITNFAGSTQVDLPDSVKLTFKERIKSAEGMGDDKLGSVVSVLEAVEWELEFSSLPLEALAIIYGDATSTAGTTPDQAKTLKREGATRLPYFKLYGKSLGEGDDDVHCILFKCKVTEGLDTAMQYGEMMKPTIKGIGIDDGTNGVYKWVQNETADDLPAT